jgi:hypothetical protein
MSVSKPIKVVAEATSKGYRIELRCGDRVLVKHAMRMDGPGSATGVGKGGLEERLREAKLDPDSMLREAMDDVMSGLFRASNAMQWGRW